MNWKSDSMNYFIENRNKIRKWLLLHPKINPFNNLFRMYSSSSRLLPDVMIVGFHKTATTSLHNYLIQHPNILKPTRKEIGYFSVLFWRGEMWYKSHFLFVFLYFLLSFELPYAIFPYFGFDSL